MNNNLLIFLLKLFSSISKKYSYQSNFHLLQQIKKRQTAFLASYDGRHGIRTHARFYTPTAFPTQPLKPLE